MSDSFICRRSGSSGEVKYTFNNYTPSWSQPTVSRRYPDPDPLDLRRYRLTACSAGNYAIFGGGVSPAYSDMTDAYDTYLIKHEIEKLSIPRECLASTTVGDYAIFGGGKGILTPTTTGACPTVETYNASLERLTRTSLETPRYNLAAAAIGTSAVFAGGKDDYVSYDVVEAYKGSTFTRSTLESLSDAKYNLAACQVGNYILFGGGDDSGSYYTSVDVYDSGLNKLTPIELAKGRNSLAAATIGNNALFAGGNDSSGKSDVVEAFNGSTLTRSTLTKLSEPRSSLASATIGDDYALFAGGILSSGYSSKVDKYNTSLDKSTTDDLIEARANLAGTIVGEYAVFGGGMGDSVTTAVDAYKITYPDTKTILSANSKYKLNTMEQEITTSTNTEITINIPITGYIVIKEGNFS